MTHPRHIFIHCYTAITNETLDTFKHANINQASNRCVNVIKKFGRHTINGMRNYFLNIHPCIQQDKVFTVVAKTKCYHQPYILPSSIFKYM
jgi:hypothetical protein